MSNINLKNIQPIRIGGFDTATMIKGISICIIIAVVLYIVYRILKKKSDKEYSERGDNREI